MGEGGVKNLKNCRRRLWIVPNKTKKIFFCLQGWRKKLQTFLQESMTIAWLSLKSLSNFENQKP